MRLEETLDDLTRVAAALEAGEPPGSVVGALEDALAFLGRQVARHETDEEESLFPRIAGIAELAPLVRPLAAEHAAQRALSRELREAREARDVAAVAATARRLVASYRNHIAIEERDVFPVAERALGAEALRAMSDEMEARRE